MGPVGRVGDLCDKKGLIIVDKETDADEDALRMGAVDAGAEDFYAEEVYYEIITSPDDFSAVREALEGKGYTMSTAEVTMLPQNYIKLTEEDDIKNMNKLIEHLEDNDDVQNVYHSWDEE